MIARIFAAARLAGWLSLFAGFSWAALSIKAMHELPRTMKEHAFELLHTMRPTSDDVLREDACKCIAVIGDEMTDNLPDTVAPVSLLFGGGMILGIVPRRQKTK